LNWDRPEGLICRTQRKALAVPLLINSSETKKIEICRVCKICKSDVDSVNGIPEIRLLDRKVYW